MSAIGIHGLGVVSPAGWGLEPFRQALKTAHAPPVQELQRPGWTRSLRVRRVPAPQSKPAFLAHPRLRRTSAISQYAVAAAIEALGTDADLVRTGQIRLGIILCVMSGCVNYSRRFYDEALKDPATASPLVFPETVFNAPASHLGALLGTTMINYTLVGDPASFLQGLVIGSDWLTADLADGCVIIGAEESDWLTADAFRLFTRRMITAEGAGAVYLRQDPSNPSARTCLAAVSDPRLFVNASERRGAAEAAAREAQDWATAGGATDGAGFLLCDGLQNIRWLDGAEASAWRDWKGPRISVRRLLGEGLMAAAAWQCVAAADAVEGGMARAAIASVCGINEHVMWASFKRVAARDQGPPS